MPLGVGNVVSAPFIQHAAVLAVLVGTLPAT